MNKFVFIIEGADKCGKSELCKHLIDKFKCNYIHNGKYRKDPFMNYDFQMDILKTFENSPSLILDRYALSNYVYSQVFRDGEDPLPKETYQAYRDHFNRIARNHGYTPIWIIASPDKTTWVSTFMKSVNSGNELYTNMDRMHAVYDMMYIEGLDKDNYVLFDWTEDSDYQKLDTVIKEYGMSGKSCFDTGLNENSVQIADLMSKFRYMKDSGVRMQKGTYEFLNYKFEMNPTVDIEFQEYKMPWKYLDRELNWYLSLDRSVKGWMEDIKIWNDIASKDDKREINSNYGWCCISVENGSQFTNVVEALEKDSFTRQAQFIYTRPSMHKDWCEGGRHDFICTNTVQVFIRNNKLYYKIDQRSLDTFTGLKADWAWHVFVFKKLMMDLSPRYPNLEVGKIFWNIGSCHVYERSFESLDKITNKM